MSVEHIINVPTLLPVDLMDRPHGLGLALLHVGFLRLVSQLIFQSFQYRLYIIKAWRRLSLLAKLVRKGHDRTATKSSTSTIIVAVDSTRLLECTVADRVDFIAQSTAVVREPRNNDGPFFEQCGDVYVAHIRSEL